MLIAIIPVLVLMTGLLVAMFAFSKTVARIP